MKKLLAILLVFVTVASANAALVIGVNNIASPSVTPTVPVNGTAIISLWSDDTSGGTFYMGTTTASPAWLEPPGGPIQPCDNSDFAALLGIENPFIVIELPGGLTGKVADNIVLHCTGLGDAAILLFDSEGGTLDSQVVHQPEPATIALLGLGALLLRRKK